MIDRPTLDFAGLLRQMRVAAQLTQEELAEAAGVSPRTVSDLERGISRRAHKDTARLLADALGLTGESRAEFEAAARGRAAGSTHGGIAGATRTLPRDIASFTGRDAELRELVESSASSGGIVNVQAIGGMAGVGKTTLAVHAAHRLTDQFPDGQMFLPLHGHTPGQRPVGPEDALVSLLLTIGVPAARIPPGLEARSSLWRDHLAGKRLLLLLDDAVNSEQVRPLLPGSGGNLVLVTSRRRLTALDDGMVINIDILSPDESVSLLIRLAARPELSQGDGALADIARLCGYLPLAIGMLARQLHHHPAWTPGDLAAELSAARDRLELMSAENLSVAAAFDLSYQTLIPDQQRLFRRLGLHPGSDLDAYAIAALSNIDLTTARRLVTALYDHYLLTEPGRGRYRLHDLVREHARALASMDPPAEREAALGRLLDYYLATARLADRHLALRVAGAPTLTPAPPAHAPDLGTSELAMAWMSTERPNLHAIFEYAAASGKPDYATAIAAAMDGFLRKRHWDEALTLHRAAAELARQAGNSHAEADALTDLAHVQDLTADFTSAAANLDRAIKIYRRIGYKTGEARALNELGTVHRLTGRYPPAAVHLTLALELFRDSNDQLGEADTLFELGSLQHRTGALKAATASQTAALEIYRDIGYQRGEAWTLNALGVTQYDAGDYGEAMVSLSQALELQRSAGNSLGEANTTYEIGTVHRLTGDYPAAVATQLLALQMYRDLGYQRGEANVLTEIGTVRRLTGDYPAAIACQQQALALYRAVSDRFGEGIIFKELGAVQHLTGGLLDASVSLSRALQIFRNLGDQANTAEVLNYMGELALESADADDARNHFEEALAIASSITTQPEEARALEGVGRCHLQRRNLAQAADSLRRALVIYQRIGSLAAASRVQEILDDRRLSGIE